jgi:hypothetical protein
MKCFHGKARGINSVLQSTKLGKHETAADISLYKYFFVRGLRVSRFRVFVLCGAAVAETTPVMIPPYTRQFIV